MFRSIMAAICRLAGFCFPLSAVTVADEGLTGRALSESCGEIDDFCGVSGHHSRPYTCPAAAHDALAGLYRVRKGVIGLIHSFQCPICEKSVSFG